MTTVKLTGTYEKVREIRSIVSLLPTLHTTAIKISGDAESPVLRISISDPGLALFDRLRTLGVGEKKEAPKDEPAV